MAVERLSTTGANSTTISGIWTTSFGGGTGTINIQGNQLRLVTPATGSYGGSARAIYTKSYTDIDFLVRVTPGAVWTTESFIAIGIGDAFTDATNETTNCFNLSLGPSTNTFVSNYRLALTDTNLATPGYTYTGSTAVWVRFRKLGWSIAGKIWDDGTNEPSGWTAIYTSGVGGPVTTSPMYPFIGINTGAAATAITHNFDGFLLDNLRPPIILLPPSAGTSSDTLLNPGVDVSNAGLWTTNTGATTFLYTAIDEDVASDSDYIQSPAGPSSAVYEDRLQGHADPASSTGHILHARYKKDSGTDTVNLQVDLVENTTVRATRTFNGISTSFVTDDYTLSTGETDSITDYTNLRTRFTATGTSADPAKVQDAATLNSTTAALTFDYVLTGLTVGNLLIIRTSAENNGTNGAASTVAVSNQTGTAIDATNAQKFQANADPGVAGAGATCNVIVAKITGTSGTVRLTYGNSVRQAGVAEEWSGLVSSTAAAAIVGVPVTATSATTAQPSLTDTSVASGNLTYVAVAAEGPSTDTYTNDSDTTNGSWVSLTKLGMNSGTATNDQTVVGAYKIATGTGAQAWDNATINNARDSAGIIVELARAAPTSRAVVSWAQLELPGASTPISSSDTGSGTESNNIGLSGVNDPGSGAEASNIALTYPDNGSGSENGIPGPTYADTGTAADAVGGIRLTGVDDPATGAESNNLALSATETALGADAVGSIGPIHADTGSGADAVTLITPSTTESASGSESNNIATSGADTGTSAEATDVALSAADTGSSAETNNIGVSAADTGSGADAVSLISPSHSDIGAGAENNTISATISGADTGGDTENQNLALTAADTGSSSEDQSPAVLATGADTGTAFDAVGGVSFSAPDTGTTTESPAIALSVTETGTSAEDQAAALSAADTGTATDNQSLSVQTSDTATSTEAASISVILTSSDTGTDSETGAIATSGADSGSSAENQSTAIETSDTDTASSSDAVSLITPVASESGSSTDTNNLALSGAVDTGSATDDGAFLIVSADTATSLEANSLALASAESGSAVDTELVSASSSSADSGTTIETQLLLLTAADTASSVDNQTLAIGVTSTDTGSGDEVGSAIPLLFAADSDTGSAIDDSVLAIFVSSADTALADEPTPVFVAFLGSETGTADDFGRSPSLPVSDSDTGSGVEAGTIRLSKPEALTITITASTRPIAISALPRVIAIEAETRRISILVEESIDHLV